MFLRSFESSNLRFLFRANFTVGVVGAGALLLAAMTVSGCHGCGDPAAMADTPTWERTLSHATLGGTGESLIEIADGDFVVAGYVYDNTSHMLLMRCDSEGNKRWSVAIGPGNLKGVRVLEVADGFLIFGDADDSNDYYAPERDYHLVKTDDRGRVQWEKRFGSAEDEAAADAVAVEGGFVLLGTTKASGAIDADLQLIRVDEAGELVWSREFDHASKDAAVDLEATSDGGFAVLGHTVSPGRPEYDFEYYMLKTDREGTVQWDGTFGSSRQSFAGALRQTADGGFILAGTASSKPNLIKVDADGVQVWEKFLAGSEGYFDDVYGMTIGADGGIVLAGKAKFNISCDFALLVKADENGNQIWSRIFGDEFAEGKDIITSQDGAHVLVGFNYVLKNSSGGVYIAKVNADGN